MELTEVRLERALFSEDVVTRTAHRYTGNFFARIRIDDPHWVISLIPKNAESTLDELVARFENDALDELLRERIRTQTHEIHSTLVSAALRETFSGERSKKS
jgi:His-Xaa-Ser system protein HxsD